MKNLLTIGTAAMAIAAFGAANDTLVTFSTQGPDKYMDNSQVLPGECYALVWSADGQFEGIKGDGTTVDPADKVVMVAPVATQGANGMHCPDLVYQLDAAMAAELEGGVYDVYLLDTRVPDAATGGLKVGGVDANGKLTVVNGAASVAAASEAGTGIAGVAAASAGGVQITSYAQVDAPVITAIKPNGAKIKISVASIFPNIEYKVISGTEVGNVSKEIDATLTDGEFEFDKPADGKFFKVIGVQKVK